MVYHACAVLAFSTAARRDAVLADVQSRIANRPRWGTTTVVAMALEIGEHGLVIDTRFTSKADQSDLMSRVEAFATGARLPLAGSEVRLHDCTHDESPQPCVSGAVRVW